MRWHEYTGQTITEKMPQYLKCLLLPCKRQNQLRSKIKFWVPAVAVDFLSAETGVSAWPCKGTAFSAGSDRMVEPDGTKAARSGGWSFPTGGLAYKKRLVLFIQISNSISVEILIL